MGKNSLSRISQMLLEAKKYLESGQLKDAAGVLSQIVAEQPDDEQTLKFLLEVTGFSGDLEFAEDIFQKLAAIHPENHGILKNLANILNKRGKYFQARDYLQKILNKNPDDLDALISSGDTLSNLKMHKEAAFYFDKAASLSPDNFVVLFNLATTFLNAGQYSEAADTYQKAIKLNPNYATAYAKLGVALKGQGKVEEAIAQYDWALSLADEPETRRNRAIALLMTGNLKDGFREFEWRKKIKERRKSYEWLAEGKTCWRGEIFSGKRLLVHHEQGFGDNIHFSRYLKKVKTRGGVVIFSVPRPLFNLYKNFPGVDILTEYTYEGCGNISCDLVVPLMSLPYIFGTTMRTIPNETPYLKACPVLSGKWREKIFKISGDNASQKLRVGLAWAGSSLFNQDYIRSCALKALAPLANISGVDYYSIQVGDAAQEAGIPPKNMRLFDLTGDINDFADTAALIDNLDLVISVDTAVAHLAGALGKQVWTLLYYANDWRWFIRREDSPWYPSMRLFRQFSPGDWDGVAERVAKELELLQMKRKK